MAADDVFVELDAMMDGDLKLPFFVHDVDIEMIQETMGTDGVPMLLHVLTGSAIGGIAFDDRSFDVIDQFADEFGVKIVVTAHFAGRDLHSDFATEFSAKRIIDANQTFGGDFFDEINFGFAHNENLFLWGL
jgi:hypothetical protein